MVDEGGAAGQGEVVSASTKDVATSNAASDIALALDALKTLDVLDMAKDKYKTRVLQKSLEFGDREVAAYIFGEVEPEFLSLAQDQFGNYLCQKMLQVADDEQFGRLFDLLKGQLLALAGCVHGARAVQNVVEQGISRGKVAEVLAALPPEAEDALVCTPTGFHVVVKLVELLPRKEVELLLERLCGTPEKVVALATDQWGCCIMKKCIDRVLDVPASGVSSMKEQEAVAGATRDSLVEAVTSSSLSLVQDKYGNYVVQHLILRGRHLGPPNLYVTGIVDALRGKIFELSFLKFSSNVLEKCLVNSEFQDRGKIVNELLSPPSCPPSEGIRRLMFHQYGNYVFQQALELTRDPQFSLLVEHSKQHVKEALQNMPMPDEEPVPDSEDGTLGTVKSCRLAAKLIKKHWQFAEGLAPDVLARGMWDGWESYPGEASSLSENGYWTASPMGPPAMWGLGVDMMTPMGPIHVGPFNFGVPGMPAMTNQPSMGRRGRKGGGKGGKGGGKRGKGKAAPETTAQDLAAGRGGRIVGFWPNYSIEYDDEVPAAPAAGRRGRSKSQGKGAQG